MQGIRCHPWMKYQVFRESHWTTAIYTLARTFRGCMFSPTEPWARWMELDHMDFRAEPTWWHVGAALHFLLLQVRGDVIVREEHGLQMAHIRQGWVCKMETKQGFVKEKWKFHRRELGYMTWSIPLSYLSVKHKTYKHLASQLIYCTDIISFQHLFSLWFSQFFFIFLYAVKLIRPRDCKNCPLKWYTSSLQHWIKFKLRITMDRMMVDYDLSSLWSLVSWWLTLSQWDIDSIAVWCVCQRR